MKFDTQSQGNGGGGNSDIPQEAWEAWHDYYWSCFAEAEEPTKKKDGSVVENSFTKKIQKVGLANFFLDVGLQPQPDSSYDSNLPKGTEDGVKGHGIENIPEGYSEEEKAHVRKFPDNYFQTIDGKRQQLKPERPTQEIYVAFDIPDIQIDWSKHPIEKLQRLGVKPLRVSINGYFSRRNANKEIVWEGFGKSLRFNPNWKTNKLSPNNPINKLAANMSLASEFEDSGYDFDKLLGGATNVTFTVTARKEDGKIINVYQPNFKQTSEIVELNIPNVGKFTREQQIPECDITPVSVMLNQETFSDDVLELITNKRELKAVLPKATSFQPNSTKAPDFWLGTNWEDTNLCKALGGFGDKPTSSSSGGSGNESSEDKQQASKEEAKVAPKVTPQKEPEPTVDWDDDK